MKISFTCILVQRESVIMLLLLHVKIDKKHKEASQYRGTMDNIQRQFTTEHG